MSSKTDNFFHRKPKLNISWYCYCLYYSSFSSSYFHHYYYYHHRRRGRHYHYHHHHHHIITITIIISTRTCTNKLVSRILLNSSSTLGGTTVANTCTRVWQSALLYAHCSELSVSDPSIKDQATCLWCPLLVTIHQLGWI